MPAHKGSVPWNYGTKKPSGHKRAYKSWHAMVSRCTRPHDSQWKDYGGRGISVCQRWMSFEVFVEDMGWPPQGQTLERIDNDAGYSPENCRWATRKEQAMNRRNNRLLTMNGQTRLLTEWADQVGIPPRVVSVRLFRGWTVERALTKADFRRKQCSNA